MELGVLRTGVGADRPLDGRCRRADADQSFGDPLSGEADMRAVLNVEDGDVHPPSLHLPVYGKVKGRSIAVMRIGEVADRSGVPAKTIRYYESLDLLPAPSRAANGYRTYDESILGRLVFIRAAQASGLTLGEIRGVLAFRDGGDTPCDHVRSLIDRRAAELDERITELQRLRGRIDRGSRDVCAVWSRPTASQRWSATSSTPRGGHRIGHDRGERAEFGSPGISVSGGVTSHARLAAMGTRGLDRVRRIAVALPEVTERMSHGEPCFFVRDVRPLCYYHDNRNGDGRVTLWCPAPAGVASELASAEPKRFFKPVASASGTFAGWLGVFLDTTGSDRVDWDEIAAILEEAYRCVAPAETHR